MVLNENAEQRMKNNILNELNENESVYRFLKIDHFFEMIDKKELILRKPSLWNDPFEDFLSKTTVINKRGERVGFNVTKDMYGQCWTLRNECDGIWKNYADLEMGVRIESKALNLLKAIYDKNDPVAILSFFIGKVIYTTDTEIRRNIGTWISNMLTDSSGKEIARFLLIKREEFMYEKEVRLLCSRSNPGDYISVKIEPTHVIKSILFSPKMSGASYDSYKMKLLSVGFKEDQISKSSLYDPIFIKIDYDI
ncbi:MAG: DUF2971 domain-containing protein [Syntrophales bacterium]